MVLLSAHQPTYLPWMGLLNKIYNSNIFIILDKVQYEKGGYINRTKIKTSQGAHWLTIPVPRDSYKKKINEVWTVDENEWCIKHTETVKHNYKKCDYFRDAKGWGTLSLPLSHINTTVIRQLCDTFDIQTPLMYQPALGSKKQDFIIDLCKYFNADAFLFGAKGRDYVDVEYFKKQGIEPLFQDFRCIEYPQQWGGDFIPGLSVIDALFNVGAEKTFKLIKGGYSVR